LTGNPDQIGRATASKRWVRPPITVAVGVTVVGECVLVLASHLSGAQGVTAAVIAASGWGFVVTDARLESRPALAAAAIALAFAAAVAVSPRGSHDLWSYVMYGRTLAVHHASPYSHAPGAYPHDPLLHLVGSGWRGTKSVYGPLFTGVSAVLTKVAGTSALRARLAFQGLAVAGVAAVLFVIWLETRSVRAVTFVGLHPVVVTAIVNGGHNDGLVGLSVLVGAVLLGRRRPTAAGVAVGLGMLVKASTGLGIFGIAMWSLGRDRRATSRFLVVAALTTAVGYLPAGTAALHNVSNSANRTSRASIWSPIARAVQGPVGAMALTAVAVLALVAAVRLRSQPFPAISAAGSFAAYLVVGAYVLPWYSAWALPSAALARRTWVAILVAAHAAFLVVAYEFPRRFAPGSFDAVGRAVSLTPIAIVALSTYVVLLARPNHPFARPVDHRAAPPFRAGRAPGA
jgi:hypothetical protein